MSKTQYQSIVVLIYEEIQEIKNFITEHKSNVTEVSRDRIKVVYEFPDSVQNITYITVKNDIKNTYKVAGINIQGCVALCDTVKKDVFNYLQVRIK